MCDAHCTKTGCTGPGPRDCLQCRKYRQKGVCVERCGYGWFGKDHTCVPCHSQCKGSCYGTVSGGVGVGGLIEGLDRTFDEYLKI